MWQAKVGVGVEWLNPHGYWRGGHLDRVTVRFLVGAFPDDWVRIGYAGLAALGDSLGDPLP
jgi:hypothetical protein